MNTPNIKVGQRVILARSVERFPSFLVPAGARGTVTFVEEEVVGVRMDLTIPNCEEWENQIFWDSDTDSLPDFEADIVRTYII